MPRSLEDSSLQSFRVSWEGRPSDPGTPFSHPVGNSNGLSSPSSHWGHGPHLDPASILLFIQGAFLKGFIFWR